MSFAQEGILADTTIVEPFSVSTQPTSHNLCGALSYTAEYDDIVIDNTDRPLSYEETAVETFSLQSDDYSNVNTTHTYSLTATFADWSSSPGVSVEEVSGNIIYNDPCLTLTTFEATTQADIPNDEYSGTIYTWTVTDFNVQPV